ncbi:MAG TPA: hydantoinase/oxoprolinase family protein [Solirubrobacter sp.]|nr:hydantoinase/oxoprolinase family protein [Solirubrobacter sp.]
MSKVFAVDVGGTFTDLFLFDEEAASWRVEKTPTTPDDFSRGIFECIERAEVALGEVRRAALHGSTVADNAIIERRYPRTALLTTDGFRDLLEMGRWWREHLYDLQADKPQQVRPLIPRELRRTVRERIGAQGDIAQELDEDHAREVIRALRAEGVDSFAVFLINSFANARHEERLAELIAEQHPKAYVSLSSRLLPKARELPRLTTTVVNACIQPILDRYLTRLESGLRDRGFGGETLIMQSNGGTSPLGTAKTQPAYMATSGPAAGVVGAAHLGELIGRPNMLAFDMGGTTAKAALLVEGESQISYDFSFEWDTPIAVPMIHLSEVGAGGGSVAWVDPGGMLRVGPQSAGAVPGPACYGRGGTEPTITDANLVLNRLDPSMFLAGRMALDVDAAEAAVDRLADQLGLSREATALGILELAETTMAEALRSVSLNKGHDPRDFVLVAFGGGGPAHAASLARHLGIREVVIPVDPGVFSAFGMCNTDVVHDFMRSIFLPFEAEHAVRVQEELDRLEAACERRMRDEGVELESVEIRRFVSLKYAAQAHELEVELDGPLTADGVAAAAQRFHETHLARHGFAVPEEPVAITDVRLSGTARVPRVRLPELAATAGAAPEAVDTVEAVFGGATVSCRIYRREALRAGQRFDGPAVITEQTSTTVVPPATSVTVDGFGNLILHVI